MRHILKCTSCGKYTLTEECSCGGKTLENKPPKYSPEDKFGEYRRQAKEEERKKQDLI
ncbi:MAG: RNA-protein complex protein Nop10 [Nanoarchaeota archaeon]|nr:RNA-protein complex protein Nop10 [Nanoarchaeota archaeon]